MYFIATAKTHPYLLCTKPPSHASRYFKRTETALSWTTDTLSFDFRTGIKHVSVEISFQCMTKLRKWKIKRWTVGKQFQMPYVLSVAMSERTNILPLIKSALCSGTKTTACFLPEMFFKTCAIDKIKVSSGSTWWSTLVPHKTHEVAGGQDQLWRTACILITLIHDFWHACSKYWEMVRVFWKKPWTLNC